MLSMKQVYARLGKRYIQVEFSPTEKQRIVFPGGNDILGSQTFRAYSNLQRSLIILSTVFAIIFK